MENIVKILFGEYSAKINITRGANCISLKNSKYNASVLREPDYSKPLDNPYLYGMPILFPVNRIEGGEFAPLEKCISRHYRAKKSGAIELYDKSKNLRVIYENDEKFKWRLFYNGNADEFICLFKILSIIL